jgi:FkbM family methyltransferase
MESVVRYNYSFKRRLANALRTTSLYAKIKALYRQTLNRNYLLQRRELINFFKPFVQADDLVFDIGANLGDFSDAFLQLGTKVYGFEPNPFCIQELLSLYGDRPNFTLVQQAVGASEGPGTLYLGADGMHGASTLSVSWTEAARQFSGLRCASWRDTIDVEVTTLDRLIQTYGVPAFCKIDVEGFELEVLRGLSQAIPCLSIEYVSWDIEPMLQCIAHLAQLGPYEFNLTTRPTPAGIGSWHYADWLSPEQMRDRLDREIRDQPYFGDLYARTAKG